ncbi:MAG TPA: aminotransferase class V-fold PLP-dependent enzyme [Bryobacteraceae bacterium]|nr:aminotransferase class V-fold PLP-dependent enzyme [Bryobacteraceae bacterium]
MRFDVNEFRRLGHRAIELAADHLEGLAAKPVFQRMQESEREAILKSPLGNSGISSDEILDFLSDKILRHPMGNGHPRFLGWVNSPPDPMGVLMDLLAAAMNPSCAGGDHAAIYLEHCVIRWLMELLEFPRDGSYGLLVSGGSAASLTALAAARHRIFRDRGMDVRKQGSGALSLRLYASTETHTCIQKALEILGLGSDAISWIETNGDGRIRLDLLRSAIRDERERVPFCVVGNAGTVARGAIDHLDGIADIAREFGLWFHVDGAYGAVGRLDAKAAPAYQGMERGDSIALDPHKWLSVPVECGCVLVRDGKLLRDTFSLVPPYVRTEPGKGIGNLPWFAEYGFQQTRGFRALKLWATLAHEGRQQIAARIAKHNELARYLEQRIEASPDLELCSNGVLSIVCFRCRPHGASSDEDALNALNKEVMERMQSAGVAFITGAMLGGRFVLRACILHYATTERDLDIMLDALRAAAASVLNVK